LLQLVFVYFILIGGVGPYRLILARPTWHQIRAGEMKSFCSRLYNSLIGQSTRSQ